MIRPQDIRVGTSGWKFTDWAGVFYPFRVPQSKWLEFYAARFPIGEINSTYYRIAPRTAFEGIAKKTPEIFRLFAKVHRVVTHTDADPTDSMGELLFALDPLRQLGKLEGLLAQFPNWFVKNRRSLDRVSLIAELTKGVPLCVEFRHSSWDSDEAESEIRDRGLTWVIPDEPRIDGLMTNRFRATTKLIYIRLHGRNSTSWYDSEAGDRYDYDYSEREIREIMQPILQYDGEANRAIILFNNCYRGQAPNNAVWLQQWLAMMHADSSPTTENNGLTFQLDK